MTFARLALAALLVAAPSFAAPSPAPAPVASAVKQSFEAYRTALQKRDGKAAAARVDAPTLAEYARMGKLALEADAAALKKEPLTTQLFVLQLRQGMDLEGLKQMKGDAIFQHAVTVGWIGPDALVGIELGEVTVEGNVAHLAYARQGKTSPVQYDFQKDKAGAWKIDLRRQAELASLGLKLASQKAQVTPEAFLMTVLAKSTGQDIPDSIWDKPAVK